MTTTPVFGIWPPNAIQQIIANTPAPEVEKLGDGTWLHLRATGTPTPQFFGTVHAFANVGDPPNPNPVLRFGWNVDQFGNRVDASRGAVALEMEGHFAPGAGDDQQEAHLAFYKQTGVSRRMVSMFSNARAGGGDALTLETDLLTLQGGVLDVLSTVRGPILFRDGVPVDNIHPGIASNDAGRNINLGINYPPFGTVNAAYSSAFLQVDTRNDRRMFVFLGAAAGNALDGIVAFGDHGQTYVKGTTTPGGTTGARTINRACGTVNLAAGASSVVVTNSLVTAADSIVEFSVRSNDATAQVKNIVPSNGSFQINMVAAVTAETSVGWRVIEIDN